MGGVRRQGEDRPSSGPRARRADGRPEDPDGGVDDSSHSTSAARTWTGRTRRVDGVGAGAKIPHAGRLICAPRSCIVVVSPLSSLSSKLQLLDFIGFYCSRLATRGLAAPSTRPEPVVRVDFAMSGGRDISIHFGWSQANCESTTGFLGVPDLDELTYCTPCNDFRSRTRRASSYHHPRGRESARRPRLLRNVLS